MRARRCRPGLLKPDEPRRRDHARPRRGLDARGSEPSPEEERARRLRLECSAVARTMDRIRRRRWHERTPPSRRRLVAGGGGEALALEQGLGTALDLGDRPSGAPAHAATLGDRRSRAATCIVAAAARAGRRRADRLSGPRSVPRSSGARPRAGGLAARRAAGAAGAAGIDLDSSLCETREGAGARAATASSTAARRCGRDGSTCAGRGCAIARAAAPRTTAVEQRSESDRARQRRSRARARASAQRSRRRAEDRTPTPPLIGRRVRATTRARSSRRTRRAVEARQAALHAHRARARDAR